MEGAQQGPEGDVSTAGKAVRTEVKSMGGMGSIGGMVILHTSHHSQNFPSFLLSRAQFAANDHYVPNHKHPDPYKRLLPIHLHSRILQ